MDSFISKRLLRERAKLAREIIKHTYKIDDPTNPFDGLCDPVCIELCKLLERIGIQTDGIASVKFNNKPHYVTLIPSDQLPFTTDTLLIDPTIDQFEDELHSTNNLTTPITILSIESNTFHNWYTELEPIQDKRLQEWRGENK